MNQVSDIFMFIFTISEKYLKKDVDDRWNSQVNEREVADETWKNNRIEALKQNKKKTNREYVNARKKQRT